MKNTEAPTAWMKCTVQKGMFSTEYIVVVNDKDGNQYGDMFVDKSLVKLDHDEELGEDESVPGRVRVYTSGQKRGPDNLVTVLLPVPTMQHGIYHAVPENWLTSG